MTQRIFLSFIWAFSTLLLHAQLRKEIVFEPMKAKNECIRVKSFQNKTDKEILLKFDESNSNTVTLKPKTTQKVDITAYHIKAIVQPTSIGQEEVIWNKTSYRKRFPEKKVEATEPVQVAETEAPQTEEKKAKEVVETQPEAVKEERKSIAEEPKTAPSMLSDDLSGMNLREVYAQIYSDLKLTHTSITELDKVCENHQLNLFNWTDKQAYVTSHQLKSFIGDELSILDESKKIEDAVISKYADRYALTDENIAEIKAGVNQRMERKHEIIRKLQQEIEKTAQAPVEKKIDSYLKTWGDIPWKPIAFYGLNGLFLLLILVFIVKAVKKSRKQKNARNASRNNTKRKSANSSVQPGIVVRRTTTTILKTQCVDDVIDNPNYLPINCAEFSDNCAVKRMYLKNTCVKAIYDMYAEDLRNPENPKEDGCMVLGRWAKDPDGGEYYVTLEQIVLPGDDAVFDEYELNFGAKIKIKVAEQLRKLRRETNLQYDLTCWVHSHPGLGVFFSNADNNVHLQLKHPTHPLFLTAFVVDILTPDQEMGIFTFKKDGTINAKPDLKKMYSLDQLYQWAVKSEQESLINDDLYNILGKAKKVIPSCAEVLLNNGAIIDMDKIAMLQNSGAFAFVHGCMKQRGDNVSYLVSTIDNDENSAETDFLGCFITESYCSIPTVRKVLSKYLPKSHFVFILSSTDGKITTIPVEQGEISSDLACYSEESYADLKAWTRRKR